jgi:hypothetical protein
MRDPATKKEWLASLRRPRVTLTPYWGLLVVFLAMLGALYSGRLIAEDLSHPTHVGELYLFAVKNGGYEDKCKWRDGGCPMPLVVIENIGDENIAGKFDYRAAQFVVLNAGIHKPGSMAWNTTLVHEFTHYLQWIFGEIGPSTQCMGRMKAEEAAYAAGNAYLKRFGMTKDYSTQMLMHALACAQG